MACFNLSQWPASQNVAINHPIVYCHPAERRPAAQSCQRKELVAMPNIYFLGTDVFGALTTWDRSKARRAGARTSRITAAFFRASPRSRGPGSTRKARRWAASRRCGATSSALRSAGCSLKVCHGITDTLWREHRRTCGAPGAGRCKAPRRRRCGVIVEERQRSRCPSAAAPRRAAARRPAGFVARSLYATRHARRSRLASGPGGRQQSASVIP